MKAVNALFGILTISLGLAAHVQAQIGGAGDGFNYSVNASNTNTITITGDYGAVGAVNIPTTINGLTVTGIGDQVFWYASEEDINLSSVTIPNSVTNIGDSAFQGCSTLTSVSLGSGVASIGAYAFYESSLENSLTIPNSVTSIGAEAFYGCEYLTSLTIGNGLTSIDSSVFYGCFSLTSVLLGSGVTSIGVDAFAYCTELSSITIPASVTSIGDNAFYDCFRLTSIYFEGNAPSADSTVFTEDPNVTIYYLPGTTGWSSTFAGRPVVLFNPLNQTWLQVTITPTEAITAGAQWQVDGGTLQNSGTMVTNLSVGNHTVSFSTISGWTIPANQTVSVSTNSVATASGTYSQTGSMQVTISPASAITAGAQWQVDGGTLQNSGATVSGLSVGNHTVGFSAISGWTTPSNQTVSVSANSTATATGTYVAILQIGSLHTTTTLSIALTATYQLPNKTNGADGNITMSTTKAVSLTSKSILKLLATSLGSPFPSGAYLAQDGGIVEALDKVGYSTNLSEAV
jgi:hypothetical protein